jgi:hypothetical protein
MITVIRHPDNVRHHPQANDSRRNSCCPSSYSQVRQHLLMPALPDEGEHNNWRTFVRNNSRQFCRLQSSSQSMKHYVQSSNYPRHENSLARLSCSLVCCASPVPRPPFEIVVQLTDNHEISYETCYWLQPNVLPLNSFSR